MTRKYRTVKFSKDVGTITHEEALKAVRELNEGKLRHGTGQADGGHFASARKDALSSGYGVKRD